ncbi:DNRLRE domain-containing protein [Planomonospora sp. ID91781]|uniref:DNRLRE domain-containing protein n=1 Tax=Planomonospora sp. ID91781 TaxID=2738135 RepID=UPI0018C440FD|nr:DNRLRE domain-containing protein [Planomonospora sp. ID91781]MBG0825969.1 DNRLRE domain-containing protein [Planomonospora sp. ID91781]
MTRTVAIGLLAAVAVTSASVAETSAVLGFSSAASAAVTPPVKTSPVTERPDRTAAALAARLQGSRVLITGETTETTVTYAEPSGSFTTEINPSPVRVQRGGDWYAIDTTLIERDGVLVPKMAKGEVEISAGGADAPMAKLEHAADESFALSWPKALPTPKVEGSKATYTDAAGPGADLVVTALPTGFRHDVVLRERPAGPVEYKLEVDTDGLKLAETKSGSLTLTDEDGKTVASAPQPVMYEAAAEQADAAAEAAAPSEIDTRVVTENGRQMLVLKPDADFLADPATQYPVVVDPTTTLGVYTDGFVRTHIADMANGDYLKVGSSDGGDTKQRSLIKFNVASLGGKHVTAAEMRLWTSDIWTSSQTGPGVTVRRLSANWSTATTNWSNQPGGYATGAVTVKSAYDSTWMKFPITAITQAWATGSPNYGVHVVGASETDFRSARWFHSGNYSAGGTAHPPALVVTYNSYPATATTVTTGVTTGTDKVAYSTATPRLYAAAADADGGTMRLDYEVSTPAGTVLWTSSASVPAGAQKLMTVPAGEIAHGQKWRWRVRGFDGLDYGPWSAYSSTYTVDGQPPAAPSIDCPDYPADAWTANTGSEVTCTLDTTSSDGSGYYWALDNPSPTTLVADPDGTGGDPLTITISPADGEHILYAKARDVALQNSAVTPYTFGVGVQTTAQPLITAEVIDQTAKLAWQSRSDAVKYVLVDDAHEELVWQGTVASADIAMQAPQYRSLVLAAVAADNKITTMGKVLVTLPEAASGLTPMTVVTAGDGTDIKWGQEHSSTEDSATVDDQKSHYLEVGSDTVALSASEVSVPTVLGQDSSLTVVSTPTGKEETPTAPEEPTEVEGEPEPDPVVDETGEGAGETGLAPSWEEWTASLTAEPSSDESMDQPSGEEPTAQSFGSSSAQSLDETSAAEDAAPVLQYGVEISPPALDRAQIAELAGLPTDGTAGQARSFGATAVSKKITASWTTYEAYIPWGWIKSPDFFGSTKYTGCETGANYWFRGDDRGKGFNTNKYRTRVAVKYDFANKSVLMYKDVHSTSRYVQRADGSRWRQSTKTASSSGIKMYPSGNNGLSGDSVILHNVGNPYCTPFADISYRSDQTLFKSGGYWFKGDHDKMPTHEVYRQDVYSDGSKSTKLIFSNPLTDPNCLASQLPGCVKKYQIVK